MLLYIFDGPGRAVTSSSSVSVSVGVWNSPSRVLIEAESGEVGIDVGKLCAGIHKPFFEARGFWGDDMSIGVNARLCISFARVYFGREGLVPTLY